MAIESWNKIDEKPFSAGFRKLVKKSFTLPDGRKVDFDIKKEGPAVCVLALTKQNSVILAKQFRPGPEEILMELPGGAMEGNESPENAIKRELLEETGYTGDFKLVGESLDDAYSTMLRFNFVATNCVKVRSANPDENEFIEIVELTIPQFREHIRKGKLTDVETGYMGLDFLGLL